MLLGTAKACFLRDFSSQFPRLEPGPLLEVEPVPDPYQYEPVRGQKRESMNFNLLYRLKGTSLLEVKCNLESGLT